VFSPVSRQDTPTLNTQYWLTGTPRREDLGDSSGRSVRPVLRERAMMIDATTHNRVTAIEGSGTGRDKASLGAVHPYAFRQIR